MPAEQNAARPGRVLCCKYNRDRIIDQFLHTHSLSSCNCAGQLSATHGCWDHTVGNHMHAILAKSVARLRKMVSGKENVSDVWCHPPFCNRKYITICRWVRSHCGTLTWHPTLTGPYRAHVSTRLDLSLSQAVVLTPTCSRSHGLMVTCFKSHAPQLKI